MLNGVDPVIIIQRRSVTKKTEITKIEDGKTQTVIRTETLRREPGNITDRPQKGEDDGIMNDFKYYKNIVSFKLFEDGFPIPIYLSESLTGIYVMSEEENISNEVEYIQNYKFTNKRSNTLTLRLGYNTNNLIGSTIMTLIRWCWQCANPIFYDISYFSKTAQILKCSMGKLTRTATNSADLEEVTIELDSGADLLREMAKKEKGTAYLSLEEMEVEVRK